MAKIVHIRLAVSDDVPAIAMIEAEAFHNAPNHKAVCKEELRQKPGLGDEIEWAECVSRGT